MTKKTFLRLIIFIILCVSLIAGKEVYAKGSFTVNKTSVTLTEGNTTTFTINGSTATGKVSITSSDSNVATVSSSSEWLENNSKSITITAKKKGETTITVSGKVSDNDGAEDTVTRTIKVTVNEKTTNVADNTNNNTNTGTKKSNNANLKTLGVTPKQYDFTGFNKSKTEYSVTIPASVNSLTVVAKAEDSKAKVNVSGNSGFETGSDNKITIKVTAEDGTTKTYTIKVTKLATDEEKPGNLIDEELYLSSLSITGIELSPAFSKNVFSYTATLNDESVNEVTINAKANNSKAKVEITGNKNLVDGENTINIVLTLDGETEQVVYQVVLNKVVETEDEGVIETNIEGPTQYTNDSKIKLYILIPIVVVVLIIVAIVVLIILIVKENKRLDAEDKKYNKNDDTTSKAEEYNVFENDENEFKGQSVEYSSKDMLDNEDENPKPNKKKGKHS